MRIAASAAHVRHVRVAPRGARCGPMGMSSCMAGYGSACNRTKRSCAPNESFATEGRRRARPRREVVARRVAGAPVRFHRPPPMTDRKPRLPLLIAVLGLVLVVVVVLRVTSER